MLRGEGAARKPEQENLVTGLVVPHEKEIRLGDVFVDALAKSQTVQALVNAAEGVGERRAGQLARIADARVVVQQLAVGVRCQQVAQLGDVGVSGAAGEVVVGAVAADDQLPAHGSAPSLVSGC
jgi:hypothetical protein